MTLEDAVEILKWIFYGTPIKSLPSELQIQEAGKIAIQEIERRINNEQKQTS